MKTQIFLLLLLASILAISSCKKDEENSNPLPSFVVDPTEGSASSDFVFDATSSFDEHDPSDFLEVRWDWNGDGQWDTEFSTNKIETHTFIYSENYDIKMEIRDSEGWSNTTQDELYVYSDSIAPVASFDYSPGIGTTMTIFKFDASESNGIGLDNTELRFRWDWEGDGIWDTELSHDDIGYHRFYTEGSYKVLLEVRNNIALTAVISKTIIIKD